MKCNKGVKCLAVLRNRFIRMTATRPLLYVWFECEQRQEEIYICIVILIATISSSRNRKVRVHCLQLCSLVWTIEAHTVHMLVNIEIDTRGEKASRKIGEEKKTLSIELMWMRAYLCTALLYKDYIKRNDKKKENVLRMSINCSMNKMRKSVTWSILLINCAPRSSKFTAFRPKRETAHSIFQHIYYKSMTRREFVCNSRNQETRK